MPRNQTKQRNEWRMVSPAIRHVFCFVFFFEIVDDKIHYETAVQKQIIRGWKSEIKMDNTRNTQLARQHLWSQNCIHNFKSMTFP